MTRLFLMMMALLPAAARAQEIPLQNCRQLPIVKVSVEKRQAQFLLDTGAAATLLNLKSFSSPESTAITMESWNGSVSANGREVVVRDFTIGEHELHNLKLLAVDLTPLERSCQRRVDGVLGADLIARLGLTIDLKNHVGILEGDGGSAEARLKELQQHQSTCEQAFNRSDEKAFSECLDPDITILTPKGDFHGRKAVMKYFKENYFGQDPPVMVLLTPRTRHVNGKVIWVECEISVTVHGQIMKLRGTALYQKTGERWLMSHMNYSAVGN